jgi:cyclopropane-fatty-acyl-phospholipid synthase
MIREDRSRSRKGHEIAMSTTALVVDFQPPQTSAKHYEHEAAFFRAFLDDYLKYGSGYFAPGDHFEGASVRMLDRAIDLALLPATRAPRVLDVGSGWGSLHRRLRERFPAGLEYHQVNPSEVQREYIAREIAPAAWTHEGGLETATLGAGCYDAVFVHDSFCHLADKRASLAKITRALAATGRVIVQDTFFANEDHFARARDARTTRFIQEEVFGFAEIVPVDALIRDAAANGLHVTLLEDVSDHYKRTVAAWLRRLEVVDPLRFPLRNATMRMLRQGGSCMGYSTLHYLAVLALRDGSVRSLKETLRSLRRRSIRDDRQGNDGLAPSAVCGI